MRENSLFIAVKGFKQDGYDYLEHARDRGAVAVMGEREGCDLVKNHIKVPNVRKAMADVAAKFYGYPGSRLKVCGVTGTNGKTTTCHLIKGILEARGKTTGLITSTVYDTGRETFVADRTTPESLDVQRLFFLMKKNSCVNAVVEVSSHALMLHRVDNVNFRVAVYTNITRDHLDFHETMDEYLQAKTRLLKMLDGDLSYAVINLDVPEFRSLFGELKTAHISYSLESDKADVYLSKYECTRDRTIFDLVTPMGSRTVTYRLPGRFNLMNALAAAAGGMASGVDLDGVVAGLEKARPISGRFNYLDAGQPFAVYIDYAHTPDAIETLLRTTRELTDGKVYVLFGCGGDRDKGKRPLMGTAATSGSDFAILTSDNPRSEDPMAIIEDVKPGLVGDQYRIIPDRKEAIEAILSMAREGDAVLLAGKGAENYQEIDGVRHEFNDTVEACTVIAKLGFEDKKSDEES